MTEKTFSAPPGDTSASATSATSALTRVMSARACPVRRNVRSSQGKIRRGQDEPPAGHQVVALSRLELVREVPREHEKKVRTGGARLLLRHNRNTGADRDLAPLVRVALGGPRDQRV